MTLIEIPGHPPTANELQRMHRLQVGRSRAEWSLWTAHAARAAGWTERRWSPVRVKVTYTFEVYRRRDYDNLVAGLKGVLDGLVQVGAIPDDNLEHLRGIDITQRIDRKATPGIAVELEVLG